MLLSRQKRERSRPELNMASMIDIVFLLLIFFMCTSSFSKPEADIPTQLPRAGAGKQASEEDFDPIRINLIKGDQGVQVVCDGVVCKSFDALTAKLRARREVADVPVVIDGQGDVPFGMMVGALDACYTANFWRVAFSARGADQ